MTLTRESHSLAKTVGSPWAGKLILEGISIVYVSESVRCDIFWLLLTCGKRFTEELESSRVNNVVLASVVRIHL